MTISSAPINGSGQGEAFVCNTATTATAVTLAAAPSNGDILFCLAGGGGTSNWITSISQTGVTWTKVISSINARDAEIWKGVAGASASASVTINTQINGSLGNIRGNISIWQGNPNTAEGTAVSDFSSTTTTTVTSSSITPTAGRNTLLLYALRPAAALSAGPTNSFTTLAVGSTSFTFAYRVVASASGSYSTGATLSTATTWESELAAFSDGGAGGGGSSGTFQAVTGLAVGASSFFMTDSGTFAYQAFVPSASALSTAGWTGLPYRVIIAWHGSAESGTNNTSQMLGSSSLPQKLGYSGTPSATFPYLCIFPQQPTTWTGTDPSSPSGGAYAARMHHVLMDAILADVASRWSIDSTRIIYTGLSQGAFRLFENMYIKPTRVAGIIPCGGACATTVATSVPGVTVSPNTIAQACIQMVPRVLNVPVRQYNSTSDTSTPTATWQPTKDEFTAEGGGRDYAFTDTGGDHESTWNTAYTALVNPAGSTLRTWVDSLQTPSNATARKRRYRRANQINEV